MERLRSQGELWYRPMAKPAWSRRPKQARSEPRRYTTNNKRRQSLRISRARVLINRRRRCWERDRNARAQGRFQRVVNLLAPVGAVAERGTRYEPTYHCES